MQSTDGCVYAYAILTLRIRMHFLCVYAYAYANKIPVRILIRKQRSIRKWFAYAYNVYFDILNVASVITFRQKDSQSPAISDTLPKICTLLPFNFCHFDNL